MAAEVRNVKFTLTNILASYIIAMTGDCSRITGEAPVFDGAGSDSGLSPYPKIDTEV